MWTMHDFLGLEECLPSFYFEGKIKDAIRIFCYTQECRLVVPCLTYMWSSIGGMVLIIVEEDGV